MNLRGTTEGEEVQWKYTVCYFKKNINFTGRGLLSSQLLLKMNQL